MPEIEGRTVPPAGTFVLISVTPRGGQVPTRRAGGMAHKETPAFGRDAGVSRDPERTSLTACRLAPRWAVPPAYPPEEPTAACQPAGS
jgi:hypothetical protein